MKKNFYLLFLICICISCSLDDNKKVKKLSDNTAKKVQLKSISLFNDSILWSSKIIGFVENRLIIESQKSDIVYAVFSYSNDTLHKEGAFGKKGQGPYEMLYPNCTIDEQKKYIYLYDTQGNKTFYEINIKNFSDIYNQDAWKKIHFPEVKELQLWRTFISTGNNAFIGLGGIANESNMLSVIYPEKTEITELNVKFPEDGIDSKPLTKRLVYNNGSISKRQFTGNYFLYHCEEGEYAEIISLDSQMNVKSRKAIVNNYPIYEILPDGINLRYIRKEFNGLKSYVTDKYVYLLPFSYPRENNYKGYPKGYSDILYVYDWEGNFIQSYELDKPIATFVVNDSDSFIIAITMDNETGEFCFEKFLFPLPKEK